LDRSRLLERSPEASRSLLLDKSGVSSPVERFSCLDDNRPANKPPTKPLTAIPGIIKACDHFMMPTIPDL
jgi:hypothetical protein